MAEILSHFSGGLRVLPCVLLAWVHNRLSHTNIKEGVNDRLSYEASTAGMSLEEHQYGVHIEFGSIVYILEEDGDLFRWQDECLPSYLSTSRTGHSTSTGQSTNG